LGFCGRQTVGRTAHRFRLRLAFRQGLFYMLGKFQLGICVQSGQVQTVDRFVQSDNRLLPAWAHLQVAQKAALATGALDNRHGQHPVLLRAAQLRVGSVRVERSQGAADQVIAGSDFGRERNALAFNYNHGLDRRGGWERNRLRFRVHFWVSRVGDWVRA
jgi:hypothetical protein